MFSECFADNMLHQDKLKMVSLKFSTVGLKKGKHLGKTWNSLLY